MINTLTSNRFLQTIYFSKSEIDKVLIHSCLFSLAMVCFRVLYTKELTFIWMIWNLFLALLPYWISLWIRNQPFGRAKRFKIIAILITWLLFVPNSFYIITDLFHLKSGALVPFWFDLALLFSFAWNGLLLGILSVRHIERWIERQLTYPGEWVFVYPVMLLNAFGIFIGRYWRFNSWDVVTNPFQLSNDILNLLLHPIYYRFDWSMIVCFSVLLSLLYVTLKRLSKAIG